MAARSRVSLPRKAKKVKFSEVLRILAESDEELLVNDSTINDSDYTPSDNELHEGKNYYFYNTMGPCISRPPIRKV